MVTQILWLGYSGRFWEVFGLNQVHGIYTAKPEAEKEAHSLLQKPKKKEGKPKKTKSIKRGEGYAIFGSEVKVVDKYRVQSKPKVYPTKAQAEKELSKMVKNGWKRSELKILRY